MGKREKVGIIGFGRFGQFWAGVLARDFEVFAADKHDLSAKAADTGVQFAAIGELCQHVDTIFLCVPIRQLAETIDEVKPLLQDGALLIDTCSIKVYPADIMEKAFQDDDKIELIASHPMFGPDSGSESILDLPIVTWPLRVSTERYSKWISRFQELGLSVVELSPDEHDQLAANSQGVTHYIGRVIGQLGLQATPIDTRGFTLLLSIAEQTRYDSWELFQDLQNYNPYTKDMRLELENALRQVYGQLLPRRVAPGTLVVGIQGGEGSFNEEACRYYCRSHNIDGCSIEYLYTTPNVLDALHRGTIDRGVFAVQSAKGGVVMESLKALGRYNCEIEDEFEILVDHCLLLHPSAEISKIEAIISHPQALAQCRGNLESRYPNLDLISGDGDLIDQAHCAKYLAAGKLPASYAVLAPKVCADLYGLQVHDTSLQDYGQKNMTTFLWVRRGRLYE